MTPTPSTWPASWASDKTVTIPTPRSVASGLADHLNGLLNATVSAGRLTLLTDEANEDTFTLGCFQHGELVGLGLHGTNALLFVRQDIRVVDGHNQTLSYSYRLQHSQHRASWIFRWEYLRQPPFPDYQYPLGHVHVKGRLRDAEATALAPNELPKFHIATGRVAFEYVLWQLISDWGVPPQHEGWKERLSNSISGFEQKRTAP